MTLPEHSAYVISFCLTSCTSDVSVESLHHATRFNAQHRIYLCIQVVVVGPETWCVLTDLQCLQSTFYSPECDICLQLADGVGYRAVVRPFFHQYFVCGGGPLDGVIGSNLHPVNVLILSLSKCKEIEFNLPLILW